MPNFSGHLVLKRGTVGCILQAVKCLDSCVKHSSRMHYLNLLMRVEWGGLVLLWNAEETPCWGLGSVVKMQHLLSMPHEYCIKLRQHIKDSKFPTTKMGFLSSNLTYLQVWASCLNELTVAENNCFYHPRGGVWNTWAQASLVWFSLSLHRWMREPG